MKNNKYIIKMGLLLLGATFIAQSGYAQNSVLRNVGTALQYADGNDMSSLIEAYNDIQKAYKHERTKNSPRMWLYRSMVYSRLADKKKSPDFADVDLSRAGLIAGVSMKNFYEHPGPKKEDDEYDATFEVGRTFVATFNESNTLLSNIPDSMRSYDSLVMYMEIADYLYGKLDTASVRNFENNGITHDAVRKNLMIYAAKSKNDELKERVFGDAIKAGNGNAIAYEGLSQLYIKRGDTAKAETLLLDGYKKNEGDKDLFNVVKNFYIITGQTDKLLSVVEEMIKKDNSNSSYFYLRGKLRDEVLNDHAAAKEDFKKAIELDDFNYDAYFDLGVNVYKYDTKQWLDAKANAKTMEERKAAEEGLKNTFKKAEGYLLRAADNTKYNATDKKNLYRALAVIYDELDKPNKAQYYRSIANKL